MCFTHQQFNKHQLNINSTTRSRTKIKQFRRKKKQKTNRARMARYGIARHYLHALYKKDVDEGQKLFYQQHIILCDENINIHHHHIIIIYQLYIINHRHTSSYPHTKGVLEEEEEITPSSSTPSLVSVSLLLLLLILSVLSVSTKRECQINQISTPTALQSRFLESRI